MDRMIIELNNLAVTCINANDLKEAINILVQALELTRNQFYNHDHHDLGGRSPSTNNITLEDTVVVSYPSSSTDYHVARHATVAGRPPLIPVSRKPTSTLPPHHDGVTTRNMVTNVHIHCSNGRAFYHQSPFNHSSAFQYLLPFVAFQQQEVSCPYNGSSRTSTFEDESRTIATIQLSVVVIFNCALCHELQAQSKSSSNTRKNALLAKAIALYEKVVNLYFQSNTTNGMINEEDSISNNNSPRRLGILGAQQDIIVMAAVNNLVRLHHERENYRQLMMALFHDVQRTDYGSEEIQRQVDLQARVFFSNTVLSSNTGLGCSAAPAA